MTTTVNKLNVDFQPAFKFFKVKETGNLVLDYKKVKRSIEEFIQLDKENIKRQFFDFYDLDGSGTIDKSELHRLMNDVTETIYGSKQALKESQIDELMQRLDLNNDRELQYEEFLLLIDSLPLNLSTNGTTTTTDGGGSRKSEFRQAMEAVLQFFGCPPSGNFIHDLHQLSGFEDDEFSNKLATYFFQFYDKNGNGKIDRVEYKKLGKDIEQVLGRDHFRPSKFMKLFGENKEAELTLKQFQEIFKQLNVAE